MSEEQKINTVICPYYLNWRLDKGIICEFGSHCKWKHPSDNISNEDLQAEWLQYKQLLIRKKTYKAYICDRRLTYQCRKGKYCTYIHTDEMYDSIIESSLTKLLEINDKNLKG
jgi:hypothetical protein